MKKSFLFRSIAFVLLLFGTAQAMAQENSNGTAFGCSASESHKADAQVSREYNSGIKTVGNEEVHNMGRRFSPDGYMERRNDNNTSIFIQEEDDKAEGYHFEQLADANNERSNNTSKQDNGYSEQGHQEQCSVDYGAAVYEDSPVWPAVLAIIALALAAYGLFLNKDKIAGKKRGKKISDAKDDAIIALQRSLSVIDDELSKLKREVNSLNSQIVDINGRVSGISIQPSRPSTTTMALKQERYQETAATLSIYATQVTSDGFPLSGVQQSNSDFAIAILSVKGNRGTYIINDCPTSQKWLLENYTYTVSPICKLSEKVTNPSSIVTTKPGNVELTGDMWRISNPAEVCLA